MSRLLIALAVLMSPLACFGEAAAPLPAPDDAAAAAAPAATETPAPTIDVAYPAQEAGTSAPGETDPVLLKVQQTGREMEKAAEKGAAPAVADKPPLAAVEAPAAGYSPLRNSMKALFGLCAALAVLFVLYYLAKRFGKNSPLFAGNELARVMGKVYLSPRASLYFVRTGGRILVLGVTPNAISPVAEFDADSFEPTGAGSTVSKSAGVPTDTDTFLSQFRASLESIARATPSETAEQDETEIAALREDVQRLQKYLQDSAPSGNRP